MTVFNIFMYSHIQWWDQRIWRHQGRREREVNVIEHFSSDCKQLCSCIHTCSCWIHEYMNICIYSCIQSVKKWPLVTQGLFIFQKINYIFLYSNKCIYAFIQNTFILYSVTFMSLLDTKLLSLGIFIIDQFNWWINNTTWKSLIKSKRSQKNNEVFIWENCLVVSWLSPAL